MPEEFAINTNLLELTRPASVVISEARAARAARGPTGEEGLVGEDGPVSGGQGFGR